MSAVLNHISTHMEDKFYWPEQVLDVLDGGDE